MTKSTRSVSSDRTIRPSDSSSLSTLATDLSNDEKSTSSSLSSLDHTSSSSSPILEYRQPKAQNKEKYSLYPTLPSKNSSNNCHRHQDRQYQSERRRSDKTIVDVIESYGNGLDISHKQAKRCADAAAGTTTALKKPSTIKIVNVTAGDLTFSTTGQVIPPPFVDETDIRDHTCKLKASSKKGPSPDLPDSSAAYVGIPQWQPKTSSKPGDPIPAHNYPSINVMEKNGVKIRRYPMRKDSLESKSASGPLSPLSSPLNSTPPPIEKFQQPAPQRCVPYSPLAVNTSSFDADSKHVYDDQGHPSNISPASTCPPSYTTATRRPATPLDPVTPHSAVWRASRSLQQHVSVWDSDDDDDDDDDDDYDLRRGSDGEHKGLVGRVKGHMPKSLVFGKRCAPPTSAHLGENEGKSKSESESKGQRVARGKSDSGNGGKGRRKKREGSSEPKRRFGRWGCGYF